MVYFSLKLATLGTKKNKDKKKVGTIQTNLAFFILEPDCMPKYYPYLMFLKCIMDLPNSIVQITALRLEKLPNTINHFIQHSYCTNNYTLSLSQKQMPRI